MRIACALGSCTEHGGGHGHTETRDTNTTHTKNQTTPARKKERVHRVLTATSPSPLTTLPSTTPAWPRPPVASRDSLGPERNPAQAPDAGAKAGRWRRPPRPKGHAGRGAYRAATPRPPAGRPSPAPRTTGVPSRRLPRCASCPGAGAAWVRAATLSAARPGQREPPALSSQAWSRACTPRARWSP
eukprot:scaffold12360_cov109-Isochrysis_galbana.AAC.10